MAEILYNGEENIGIEFTLSTTETIPNPIDLSTLTYIVLVIYYNKQQVVARYANPAITGWDGITPNVTPATGKFVVVLKKSAIKDIDPDRPLSWELKIGIPDPLISLTRDMVIKSEGTDPDNPVEWVTVKEALTKNIIPA